MEAAEFFPERIASTAVRGPCCPSPPAKMPGTVVILVFGSATDHVIEFELESRLRE